MRLLFVRLQQRLGFSLLEVVMAMGIAMIIGVAGFTLLINTVDSESKLEKVLAKGFTKLRYGGDPRPTTIPLLSFSRKAGFTRVPSARAIDVKTGIIEGVQPEYGTTVHIASAEAALFEVGWAECSGTSDAPVKCGPFVNGVAKVDFKPNPGAKNAIARLRAEWKVLPKLHPLKSSQTVNLSVALLPDCDLEPTGYILSGAYYNKFIDPQGPGDCGRWNWQFCVDGGLKKETIVVACDGK